MMEERDWSVSSIAEDIAPDLDLPPEYCRYQDEGCELAASCLNCPFPRCVNEEPGGRQRWLKTLRDKSVASQFLTQDKDAKELSVMFGISQRTVQRILKRVKNE